MMDLRQHSGGAMPANSLQFSPQSGLSNENFFLLDPNLCNSPSMDLGGLNAPFPSQLTSDFSIFMESTSQNTFGMNAGSSMDGIQGQIQASSSSLLPADEWSGTSNSALGVSTQHQQQIHFSSSSPSQGQSSLTHGPLAQSVLIETKLPVPQTYEPGLVTSSLAGSDAFATQQGQHPINKGGQGAVMTGQGRLQGMIKQTNAQGSQLSSQLSQGANQQMMLQSQFQSGEGLLAQQSHVGNAISSHILQEASFEGIDGSSQPQLLAMNIQKTGSHNSQGQHATAHASIAQGIEAESPANRFLNSDVLHRSNHGDSALGKLPISGPHLAQQAEQSMQGVRGLGLQLQEKLTRPMQTQLASQYVSQPATNALPAQNNLSNPHTINSSSQPLNLSSQESLRQNQTTVDQQNALQAQCQVQEHGQMQSGNQPSAFPSQTIYQGRQLQTGSQQLISQSNQSNSFHSVQSVSNQLQPNLQVNGAQQMVAQMQPRQMNTLFQALKAGGQQVLPRPAVSSLGFSSATEGNTKSPMPGAIASRCVQVLMRFIQEQRKRPADNDIGFWRNLVSEFFVPGATKRWCLSSYNSSPMGRHAQGLFPMDYWFCNLCGIQPGRGFASSTDVLPRLFKIKYASGLKDELLFLDMAEERYVLPNGKFVLEFQRAVHESIFPELRVVRYGRLRVTFSSSFKIFSWEFCTKIHEEVVPRKSLLQQAQQLARLVMDVEQGGFDKSAGNLKAHCNEFTAAAKQLASKLEAPSVNDLGFSKRYVRCLQIAEVVNSMKDLISFERKTGLGPIMSLAKFPSVRKLPEGRLGQSTLSQLINQLPQQGNQLPQGNASINAFPNSMSTQGQINQPQLQPNLIASSDLAVSKNGQAGNSQLGSQARAHLGAQNDGPLYQYQNGSMQPPTVQGQSQLGNQLLSRLLLQGQQSQLMSSGNQSVNFGQLSQQIYESAGHKQMVQQSSNQLISQSHSLNQTGQQSLPGTPQSEMSDMRSNT